MKLILCEGDSWTSGDIINPKLNHSFVNHPDNDSYRLPKVWPYKLGKLLKTNVINNSVAGSSNDAIVRRTIEKVLDLLETNEPDDLFVIIGWSSPERKDFYYDGKWETLYPAQLKKRNNEVLDNLWKVYTEHFWNKEEYISRFMNQNLYLHYFLKQHNIKHYFFEAFWEQKSFQGLWYVSDLNRSIKGQDKTSNEFRKIRDKVFKKVSFRKFIMKNYSIKNKEYFDDGHPTEKSHEMWAGELYKDLV